METTIRIRRRRPSRSGTASSRVTWRCARFDCHGNQTAWPWYSNIAPFSWLIQHDVQEGRARLNFSNWMTLQRGADESARAVQQGSMPQWYYVMLHPTANLSAAEKQALLQGLQSSMGGSASLP